MVSVPVLRIAIGKGKRVASVLGAEVQVFWAATGEGWRSVGVLGAGRR